MLGHLHLVFVHFPMALIPAAAAMLVLARFRPESESVFLQKWGSLLLFVGALLGVATFLTGEAAEGMVETLENKPFIEEHEELAEKVVWAIGLCGAAALYVFVQALKGPVKKSFSLALAAFALVVSVALGVTSNLGGQIAHPEIRKSQPQPAASAAPADADDDKDDL